PRADGAPPARQPGPLPDPPAAARIDRRGRDAAGAGRRAPGSGDPDHGLRRSPAGTPPLLLAAHHPPPAGRPGEPSPRPDRLVGGGIGVAASVRSCVGRKRFAIAILKCLGVSSRRLTLIYLIQALALGGLGSLAGAALGLAVQTLLVPMLGGFFPFDLALGVE